MATIKLQGADALEVSPIQHGLAYANGKRAEEGKTYSRFKYDGIAFTVDSENPFVQDFISGQVKQIKLNDSTREKAVTDTDGAETIETVRSLEFDSYISRAQWNALQMDKVADAEVEYKVNRFKKLETAPMTVTEDLLAAFNSQKAD